MLRPNQFPPPKSRGPADHALRDEILAAAVIRFGCVGYAGTRVSDVAMSIGISKAYVYKFFGSKDEIADAICARRFSCLLAAADDATERKASALEKLRTLFVTIAEEGYRLFEEQRMLFDLLVRSATESWPAHAAFEDATAARLDAILALGRRGLEFEQATPLSELRCGILSATRTLRNPVMLAHAVAPISIGASEVMGLVLRSLAP